MNDNRYQAPARDHEEIAIGEKGIIIKDIDIPFGRMIVIILKWMIASIPAVIILWVLMAMCTMIISALFGAGFALL